MYLWHLITYSYTQYKEMLYSLCSLQTNLCISWHHNLMYYGTMVLIAKNYFSHQTSELSTSDCKCQADMSSWPDVLLLLAFPMCNFVVATTKLQSNNKKKKKRKNNKKDWVIYHQTENVCRLIVLFLFLLFFMYHFVVVVATTQLHSNMDSMYHFAVVAKIQLHSNNNNNKKINLHKLLNFA